MVGLQFLMTNVFFILISVHMIPQKHKHTGISTEPSSFNFAHESRMIQVLEKHTPNQNQTGNEVYYSRATRYCIRMSCPSLHEFDVQRTEGRDTPVRDFKHQSREAENPPCLSFISLNVTFGSKSSIEF